MKLTSALAITLIILAPGVAISNPAKGLNDNPSLRLQFALDPFLEPIGYTISLGDAKQRILLRFGEPLQHDVSEMPNRFSDEILLEHRIVYDGLAFRVGERTESGHTWIQSIEISRNSQTLKFGIAIGLSRAEAIRLFQPPARFIGATSIQVLTNVFETQQGVDENNGEAYLEGGLFQIVFESDESSNVTRISITSSED